MWWATEVECVSAIARLERDGALQPKPAHAALDRLAVLGGSWNEIAPLDSVRRTAHRLLRVHKLRAGDALQLAAAVLASEGDPGTLDFVCLDDRLTDAAQREGFPVISDPGARQD